MRAGGDPKQDNPWADLVLAMLSVNNYPLTKTLQLYDSLEASGLFDPGNLASLDQSDLARRLNAAGYHRGEVMTAIFAQRLSSLGALATNRQAHERVVLKGTKDEVASLLKRVNGVGPRVLQNFFLLRS